MVCALETRENPPSGSRVLEKESSSFQPSQKVDEIKTPVVAPNICL